MNFLSPLGNFGPALSPISPLQEMGAYEAIWLERGSTFKTIADRFAADPDALPSDLIEPKQVQLCAEAAYAKIRKGGVRTFGVRVHHAGDYPPRLRDAKYPVELLYFRGAWELTDSPSIAIVGSRKPSEDGVRRAKRLAREAVKCGFTVVSGLAAGIDTAAHTEALAADGLTIAVAGTPLGSVYPAENAALQETIAAEHLLITQVPVLRYAQQGPRHNRLFFPERNVTMSALTQATVIVEAGETSGTLIQARAALHQSRKLFILDSCFEKGLTWPARYQALGAIRVKEPDDIWSMLGGSH